MAAVSAVFLPGCHAMFYLVVLCLSVLFLWQIKWWWW